MMTKTHLHTRKGKHHPLYGTWSVMKDRCKNPNNPGYENYGGRGISVCDRWLSDFQAFLDDVGERPSPQHSLDRYPDNNGNYEPGNVRWATRSEQNANSRPRRDTVWIEPQGQRMTLQQAEIKFGVKAGTIWRRLQRGASHEQAVAPAAERALRQANR